MRFARESSVSLHGPASADPHGLLVTHTSDPTPADPPPASAPRVLIADDHEDSRDALKALLEAFGYGVVVAANGEEAVAQARGARPQLILMDVMMPVVDGLAATRRIREDASLPRIPIVAVTALNDAAERMLQAGCDDYVVKPIDIRSFLVKVPGWLAIRSAERS
jgi:CheY-like chemotaxis protein